MSVRQMGVCCVCCVGGGAVVGAGDKSLGGGRVGGCVDAPGASGVQHQENEVTVCRLL